jgi:hypothetical protein
MTEDEKNAWLATRKEEASRIDPSVALVDWCYGQILDPYGVEDLSDDRVCVGRVYFARRLDCEIWVSFYDLPKAVASSLWDRMSGGVGASRRDAPARTRGAATSRK